MANYNNAWVASDSYYVYSGETANSTTVNTRGYLYVSSGGTADNTTVNSSGKLYVSSGGVANSTTVKGGTLAVSSGGTANGTTVNDWGHLFVYAGGTANSTTVKGGTLAVSSGGTANSTTVNSGAWMYVSSGGMANSTTVNSGARMYVSSGGSATKIVWTPCEGHVYVSEGGYATFASEYSGVYYGSGNMLLSSAAVMDGKTLDYAYEMYVMKGGMANSTTVNSGAWMYVSSYGTADNTTVNGSAGMHISSGGTATNATVNSGGGLNISSGGTANNITVNRDGSLYVSSGGTATDIVWTPCEGHVYVREGGYAMFASEYSGVYYGSGNKLLSSDAVMDGKTLDYAYEMYVMKGGTANNTTVNYGGYLDVYKGGTANSTTVNSGGGLNVSSGGTVNSVTVNNSGRMHISSGGSADKITLNGDDFKFHVYSGGTANSITVNPNGSFTVDKGGTATICFNPWINETNIDSSAGAKITYLGRDANVYYVGSAGVMKADVVDSVSLGRAIVYSGGTANGTTVNEDGIMKILSGGTANGTTVNRFAYLSVSGGGTANSTTVNDWGCLFVYSGGTANSVIVNSRGYLYFHFKGGTANGIVENGGYVRDQKDISFVSNSFSGLNLSDSATIHSGTTANSTTVNDGGALYVYDGGIANSTIVREGGHLYVACGGTATDIVWTPCEGHVYVREGGYATFASEYSGVYYGSNYQLISSAAVLNDLKVGRTCELFVMNSGTANNTTVNYGGYLDVYKGGTANGIVENGGYVVVADDAEVSFASNTFSGRVLNSASATVHSGTTANNIEVFVSSLLCIYNGGIANSTTITTNGGYVYVFSGGTANSTVISLGDLHVSSGGTANSTTVNSGNLVVCNGGMANSTTLNRTGDLYVSSGGTANSTTVNDGGGLYVSSGGTANGTTVNDGGGLYVSSGGAANGTTVNDGGGLYVSSGGAANGTTVNSGGYLYLSSGGTANGIVENGGYVFDQKDISFVSNSFSGLDLSDSATIHSGTTANCTTVNASGALYVYSGGIANSITVNRDGSLYVASGGTATDIVWTPCEGHVYVREGGYATFASEYSGVYYGSDYQLLASATVMSSMILAEEEIMYAMSGGTASDIMLVNLGKLYVGSGGLADTTTVSGGDLYVSSGGTANSTTVNSGAWMYVSSGGTANSTMVRSDGSLHVSDGGRATRTTINGGTIIVFNGGMASITTMNSGRLDIQGGGIAARTTVSSGTVVVSDAGFANAVTMREGLMTVLNGGEANSVYVYGGNLTDGIGSYTEQYSAAELRIFSGAIVSNAIVNGGFVHLDGTADTVTLRGSTYMSGKLFVSSGGTANGVVMSGGSLFVSSGGTANSVEVESGLVTVSFGGIVNGMSVGSGGSVTVSGGKLTGRMSFADGATVFTPKSWKTTIDFDLTQTAPNAEVLVDNLSAIQGDFLYTLTLQDTQRRGLYNLAANADDFYSTFSVVNTAGTKLGSVGIGETIMVGEADYTIELENGILTLLVERDDDTEPPVVFDVVADVTRPTSKSVTITASFKDDEDLQSSLYRIGETGEWNAYIKGVTVTENATVYFKAVDTAGNESEIVSYEVANIDKEKPMVFGITPNTTEPVKSVTVTADFADNVAVASMLYRIGDGAWTAYGKGGVTVTENCTVYFKAIDTAGNESEEASFAVTNILAPDIVAPRVVNIAADITALTNQDVTVSADFADNVAVVKKQYRIGNGAWSDYTTGVTVTENCMVTFKAVDAAGNESEVVSYKVTNIDKEKPMVSGITPNTTEPVKSVTVTADFADNVAVASMLYRIGDGAWTAYGKGGVTVTENCTVYFKAIDTAGNESEIARYDVTNIQMASANIVSGLVVSDGESVFVSANTIYKDTIISGGYLTVSSGGVANSTTVNEYGWLTVFSGGTANSTTVNEYGWLTVFSGGTANSTTVNEYGYLRVYSGGMANVTTVHNGVVDVYSGSTATNITINSGGRLYVYNGGTALNVDWTPVEGIIRIENGAHVTFVSKYSGVYYGSDGKLLSHGIVMDGKTVNGDSEMRVMSGGTANGTTVSCGSMVVMSGGTADNTSVVDIYSLYGLIVSSGGVAKNTIASNDGSFCVLSGGTASDSIIAEDGNLTVSRGGAADNTVVSGGRLEVKNGGTATNINWTPCEGTILIADGAVVTFASDYSGVYLGSDGQLISKATVMIRKELDKYSEMNVMSGGTAFQTNVSGSMSVWSGGTANSVTLYGGDPEWEHVGSLYVSRGGTAMNLDISAGASVSFDVAPDTYVQGIYEDEEGEYGMIEMKNGFLSGYTVSNGSLTICSGGTATDIFVSGGGLVVSSGGTATDLIVATNRFFVDSGGVVNNVFVGVLDSYDDYIMFDVCGNMNHVTISSGGWGFACSGATLNSVTILESGRVDIESGGRVNDLIISGGYVDIEWGSVVSNITVDLAEQQEQEDDDDYYRPRGVGLGSDAKLTGRVTILKGGISADSFGAILDFDLNQTSAGAAALVNNLSKIEGELIYTLTVDGTQTSGEYRLADGASAFDSEITVVSTGGTELGKLTIDQTVTIGGVDYTLNLTNDALSVTVGAAVVAGTAKSDIDGNGISDVMFVWTGEHGDGNYQHGYWMNGTSTWQSANSNHPAEWDNLGCYDMTGDGKADSVLFGNVDAYEVPSAYIGYYQDGIDTDENWVTIGFLTNAAGIDWKNKVGNLTGKAGANSIVWYAPELNALGAWKDGAEDWVTLSNDFGGAAWTLAGCGDFDGDGKDSVLMSYNNGQMFYTVGIAEAPASLGSANWSAWEVRAIGDFAGDGKDDIVLFHKETGAMVMCADGNIDDYNAIGQLAANDWFVVGAGDYNGDKKDDLLVRQYSTGMLGYYSNGVQANWNVMGYGVGMEWTVIA